MSLAKSLAFSKEFGGGGITGGGSRGKTGGGLAKAVLDVEMLNNRMDKGTRVKLLRAGGLLRKHIRSYMLRKRKGVSSPGSPPNIHTSGTGYDNLRHVLFTWDTSSNSMVCGPVYFSKTLGQPVPQLLEHGGGEYRARPYMQPALKALIDKGLIAKEMAGALNSG